MAAIEYRGLNAVTNFDLSRYIKWLKPNSYNNDNSAIKIDLTEPNPNCNTNFAPNPNLEQGFTFFHSQESFSSGEDTVAATQPRPATAISTPGLLLQSSKFKEMMEMTAAADLSTPQESELPPCSFPDDIQTYFECEDSNDYGEGNDIMFRELNSFVPPMFQFDDHFVA